MMLELWPQLSNHSFLRTPPSKSTRGWSWRTPDTVVQPDGVIVSPAIPGISPVSSLFGFKPLDIEADVPFINRAATLQSSGLTRKTQGILTENFPQPHPMLAQS